MYVAYKYDEATGYTAVITNGQTQGGGWLKGPVGGGFFADPCGRNPCSWNPGKEPHDWRQTNVVNATNSNGFCESSAFHDCYVEGHCQNATGTGVGAKYKHYFQSDVTTSSVFKKVTCVDGLSSTSVNSEKPYTKTAEQACSTDKNSGKDVSLGGNFPTTSKACQFMTPSGNVSLYAGTGFPAKGDGEIKVTVSFYDGCGKPDTAEGTLPKYKTVDPCPNYGVGDACENAIILSKPGSYITAGSKNVGPFLTTTIHPLSFDKAVEFSISSGKVSPSQNMTFSYSNPQVTLSGLGPKQSEVANSYLYFGESGLITGSYNEQLGGYTAGDAATLFESGEVNATETSRVTDCRGKGCDPCCTGEDCTTAESTREGTNTKFAGSSYKYTYCIMSTRRLGEYFALQPSTITRNEHLAWGEFAFSTTIGNRWNGQERKEEEFECVSMKVTGAEPGGECCTPRYLDTYFMAETTKEKKDSVTCDLGCACANNTTKVSTIDAFETEPTRCPTQVDTATCEFDDFCFMAPGSVYSGGITDNEGQDVDTDPVTYPRCCTKDFDVYGPDTVFSAINRTGTCSITYKYSYAAEYTHYTSAQSLATAMNGGFHQTIQKSEGLYYLDSKGSVKTATSYSLKQSKSDIADSHVTFAFYGPYYNPMGKTTQFGSDGAKKTFIALATGDAVYLVGSPDGKTKGTATASHDGDVHSYYISDPDATKIWNQASWPGHGVVNGKITTGTFSFSFNTGAFANSYGESGTLARFLPGANQTIVANGGLNVISSKGNASEKSFKTTYSTAAFSTSFDSTFKGAWIAKAVPYTFASTKSVGFYPWFGVGDDASSHIFPIKCAGCDFPQPAIPYPLISDTASYFVRGEKSLLYNNNATSYLWTHPAFKKMWGVGHGGYC